MIAVNSDIDADAHQSNIPRLERTPVSGWSLAIAATSLVISGTPACANWFAAASAARTENEGTRVTKSWREEMVAIATFQ